MLSEVITAAHMRGLVLSPPQEGAVIAPFPSRTVVNEPGETRGRVGALRLLHGLVQSYGSDGLQTVDVSIILYRMDGLQTLVEVQMARQNLSGEEINAVGRVAEELLFTQRQIALAESSVVFACFGPSYVGRINAFNPENSQVELALRRSLERLARKRDKFIKKADVLGVTLIEDPRRKGGYAHIQLLSQEMGRKTDLAEEGLAEKLKIEAKGPLMEKFDRVASFFDQLELTYRLDYFFGAYQGHPRGAKENAEATHYHADQGIELPKILKSYALQTPDHPLVLIHVPGDHQINMAEVAKLLGVSQESLSRADIVRFGIEPGTVNPFTGQPIPQIFSSDFFQDSDSVMNNRVFASAGDTAFYLMVDKRRLVGALQDAGALVAIADISKAEAGSIRVSTDRGFATVCGDDSVSGDNLGQIIKRAINKGLRQNGVEPADRVMPPNRTFSYPELADSIEKAEYDIALRTYMLVIIEDLRQFAKRLNKPLLVAFSSMAMQSIAREMLADIEELEYVDPKPALEARVVQILEDEQIEINGTMLVGLPSSYQTTSVFAGYILEQAIPMSEETQKELESFVVEECKRKAQLDIEANKFYNAIDKVLMRRVGNNREALKGKSFVIVLGASELINFAMQFHKNNSNYYPIRTSDPEAVKATLNNLTEDKYNKDKTRLIFVSPSEVLGEEIAKKVVTVTVAG